MGCMWFKFSDIPVDSQSFQCFLDQALQQGEIHNHIVNVHSLLLFIKWSAEQQKTNQHGEDIPGMFIGAVSVTLMAFPLVLTLLTPVSTEEAFLQGAAHLQGTG